jgi:hypothetical protein
MTYHGPHATLIRLAEDALIVETVIRLCERCRQPMGAERSTKRFCTATCRKAAHRLKGGAG